MRRYREEAGLKQEELAELLEVPQSFISKCETGERRVDLAELSIICLKLRVPLSRVVSDFEEGVSSRESQS